MFTLVILSHTTRLISAGISQEVIYTGILFSRQEILCNVNILENSSHLHVPLVGVLHFSKTRITIDKCLQ
jgi:hypothetical protein